MSPGAMVCRDHHLVGDRVRWPDSRAGDRGLQCCNRSRYPAGKQPFLFLEQRVRIRCGIMLSPAMSPSWGHRWGAAGRWPCPQARWSAGSITWWATGSGGPTPGRVTAVCSAATARGTPLASSPCLFQEQQGRIRCGIMLSPAMSPSWGHRWGAAGRWPCPQLRWSTGSITWCATGSGGLTPGRVTAVCSAATVRGTPLASSPSLSLKRRVRIRCGVLSAGNIAVLGHW